MELDPRLDPNQRFRERRRLARRRRVFRRLSAFAILALAAAGLTLGARSFGDGASRTDPVLQAATGAAGQATVAVEAPEPKPARLPEELRGVHVTMALASLEGKLGEYMALREYGLNTIELDVKDENGEVGFERPKVPLAHRVGAARGYYQARRAAEQADARGVYLIGRVVVFEDPILATKRPDLAIQTAGGGVWRNAAGLGWSNPYDERVWRYNVDVAEAAVRAGFDEIMFDYVRFPTDGDVDSAVFPGRVGEPKTATIARFLEYAAGRLRPLGARVSAALFGLSAARNLGVGQKPRLLAREVDAIYPMVYPSHYGPGEYGLDDPNAEPKLTVARSLSDFNRALRGRRALLIPWLQDFSLGRTYTLTDVQAQIEAARRARARGFMLWNAAGLYTPDALREP